MPEKIKVISIIGRLSIGGASPQVVFITQYLNKDLFEAKLIVGQKNIYEGDMLYYAKERGVSPIIIPYLHNEFKLDVVNDVKAIYDIYRIIKKEKPYIVHTHTAKAGFLGRIAARLAGVPIIIHTFHGHLFHSYFNRIKTNILIWGERILGLITNKIITVSKSLRKELIEYKIAPRDKIISISLGLELEEFIKNENNKGVLKKELGLSDDNLIVGIVGRLAPIKGHKYFIEAASIVKKSIKNVKFLIVGDGELREELIDQAKRCQLLDNMLFLGWRNDLAIIYSDMDVVVLSSLNEGLSVSIIEALSSAKPVVATAVGGVPELIVDGETGFLVEPRDGKALAEKILWLLKNREEAKKMGRRGRELVYPKYDCHKMVNNMENLYVSLFDSLYKKSN